MSSRLYVRVTTTRKLAPSNAARTTGAKAAIFLVGRTILITTGINADVRFTPESRHRLNALECPLCAKSGHWAPARSAEFGGLTRKSGGAFAEAVTARNGNCRPRVFTKPQPPQPPPQPGPTAAAASTGRRTKGRWNATWR